MIRWITCSERQFPQVVDLSVQDAIELLNEEGIEEERIIIEEVLSDDVEKGNVVAVDPQPQQRLRSGENVTLQVSRGGHYVVENYVGMSVSQLRQLFEENGINIEIIQKEEARWDVSKGTILSQSLAVGDKIDPQGDNEIEVVVASSPTFVIPSDIIGMKLQDAKDLLSSYGAAVVTSRVSEDILNEEEKIGSGLVVRCDPGPQTTYTQEGTDSYIVLYYY